MNDVRKSNLEKRIARTMGNLKKNNMSPQYVERATDVPAAVEAFLKEGETVTCGGTKTLFECGVYELLGNGHYNFLDRDAAETPEDAERIYHEAFFADTFFMSSNAITEAGELYNVDGTSNRIAALCYGPKQVIIIAGYNKIVKNLDEAILRMKTVAAPCNAERLGSKTYCASAGECTSFAENRTGITAGCSSADRICCNYLVSAKQRRANRIKVILVGEELGY